MQKYLFLISGIFIFAFRTIQCQDDSIRIPLPEIHGYFSNAGSVLSWKNKAPVWDNSLQNRLRIKWTPNRTFQLDAHLRTRLISGQTVRNTPAYAAAIGSDRGLADLSFNIFENRSALLNTQIDRLSVRLLSGPLEITLGRQRINWGQSYVWNPNDLFNAYSFFEFDYPEKPGSDAIRIQYFSSVANSFELALKADSGGRITAAGMSRFKWGRYDLQALAGVLDGEDLVAGMGWSGNIGGAGFKGEASYFHPLHQMADTSGLALISLSFDYSLPNSWYLLAEALFRIQDPGIPRPGILEYLNSPASVKTLAMSDVNLLLQLSVPIHELLNGSLAIMALPGVKGMFAGPSFALSVSDNLEASLSGQFFHGRFPDLTTGSQASQNLGIGYFRLKWSF